MAIDIYEKLMDEEEPGKRPQAWLVCSAVIFSGVDVYPSSLSCYLNVVFFF